IHDIHLRMVQCAAEGETNLRTALKKEIKQLCAGFKKPLVGINFMFATSEGSCFELSDWLHELGAIVVYGGVQSTFDFERILKLGKADIVVRFEAEDTIQNLILVWRGTSVEKKALHNVSFTSDGSIHHFPVRSAQV